MSSVLTMRVTRCAPVVEGCDTYGAWRCAESEVNEGISKEREQIEAPKEISEKDELSKDVKATEDKKFSSNMLILTLTITLGVGHILFAPLEPNNPVTNAAQVNQDDNIVGFPSSICNPLEHNYSVSVVSPSQRLFSTPILGLTQCEQEELQSTPTASSSSLKFVGDIAEQDGVSRGPIKKQLFGSSPGLVNANLHFEGTGLMYNNCIGAATTVVCASTD
ncbi:hypothetical protein VNO78_11109 [Psophocarpus tetragonolobus]|uniref:Uncharacterized protein n=1 Tax=Psophocarpus tetragonolobus TaxID=3891 RepID=A0AAN9SSH8_PSOTE